eukprot:11342665-Heterocapsa_arctica.AAC.1
MASFENADGQIYVHAFDCDILLNEYFEPMERGESRGTAVASAEAPTSNRGDHRGRGSAEADEQMEIGRRRGRDRG